MWSDLHNNLINAFARRYRRYSTIRCRHLFKFYQQWLCYEQSYIFDHSESHGDFIQVW